MKSRRDILKEGMKMLSMETNSDTRKRLKLQLRLKKPMDNESQRLEIVGLLPGNYQNERYIWLPNDNC